jgi:hypothetical protein
MPFTGIFVAPQRFIRITPRIDYLHGPDSGPLPLTRNNRLPSLWGGKSALLLGGERLASNSSGDHKMNLVYYHRFDGLWSCFGSAIIPVMSGSGLSQCNRHVEFTMSSFRFS